MAFETHFLLLCAVLLASVPSAFSAHAPPEFARYQMALEQYSQSSGRQRLFIIMLDGFRHDYLNHRLHQFPGFQKVIERGAKPEYMVPDFPTLSYPNYYSFMTGLHTERHGMTGNFMYDSKRKESFLIGSNPEQFHSHWWEGENRCGSQQRNRYTLELNRTCALYHWPGCEVEITGVRPKFCKPYSGVPSNDDFRDSIISSLAKLQFLEADVVGIYFELIDSVGHQYGPKSHKIMQIISDLDPIMGYLADSLATPTLSDVNLMIVSDHGMTSVSRKRVINLKNVIKPTDYESIHTDVAVANIYTKPGKKHEVYKKLKGLHPHLHVYHKSSLPDRWRYKHGRYVAPITAVADNGWFIVGPEKAEFPKRRHDGLPMKGWHGYDNSNKDMMGIFIGMGPAFRQNVTSQPIRIVDIYQIMCHALDIHPSPNSGSWSRVADLVTFDVDCSHAPATVTSYVTFFVLASFIVCRLLTTSLIS